MRRVLIARDVPILPARIRHHELVENPIRRVRNLRWPNYSAVRFVNDDHRFDGAPLGAKGYIIEVYKDAYEVEVSDPATGATQFLGAVRDRDLELLTEP